MNSPRLSVVVPVRDGASELERLLDAVARQTIADDLELIVVDDGSVDATAHVGRAHGAVVVRHDRSRGAAAARNSGARRSSCPFIAFVDCDCEPAPDWAERLLAAYDHDQITGVGGAIEARSDGPLGAYHERNNPLGQLEIELSRSESSAYRLMLYVRRHWRRPEPQRRRPVHALVGANMSFRRAPFEAVGGFDERFAFGGEEQDLCLRLTDCDGGRFIVEPAARVTHHFEGTAWDMLRRARAYGHGAARLFLRWPSVRPALFPLPVAVVALAARATHRRSVGSLLASLVVAPLVLPAGLREALRGRDPLALGDAYIELAQEAARNLGFIEGLWRFRDLRLRGPGS